MPYLITWMNLRDSMLGGGLVAVSSLILCGTMVCSLTRPSLSMGLSREEY